MSIDRKIGLDLVRSIAILSVVLLHLVIPYGIFYKVNVAWIPIPDGVDIFFVLSGFLIGGIVIKNFELNKINKKSILEFWIMRWFRTLPNYYLLTFVIFIIHGFHIQWRNLFFLQNFYKFHLNTFPESWSLSVEEWFYLTLPIGIFILYNFFVKNVFSAIIYTALGMLVFSLCARLFLYFYSDYTHTTNNFLLVRSLVITRLDAIAVGILGAIIKYYKKDTWNSNSKIYFYIGLCVFVVITCVNAYSSFKNLVDISFYRWNIDMLIYSISILLMFPFLENINIKNRIFNKFITQTSLLSYSMYLIHNSILFNIMAILFIHFKITNYLFFIIVYIPLLYFLCYLNYNYFEKRFIDYRNTFVKKYLHKS